RIPPRRAHDTLQPQDESIIVGYYTSAEVHSPKATRISTAPCGARKEFYGKRRRYPSYQCKKYETYHTQTEKREATQRARKRIVCQSGYSPGTLPSECSLQATGWRLSGAV